MNDAPESTVSPEIRRGIARMVSELMTGPVYFPQLELDPTTGEVCRQHIGATMLDHFAGQAMLGLLNRMTELDGDEPDIEKAGESMVGIAGLSYQMGLHMIEARRRALAGDVTNSRDAERLESFRKVIHVAESLALRDVPSVSVETWRFINEAKVAYNETLASVRNR